MPGFTSISETLKQESQRGPAKAILLALRVEKMLGRLLPRLLPKLTGKTRMRSLREGRLIISTSSPAASQEVFLHRESIRKELNENLGKEVVEEVRLRISNPNR